MRKNFAPPAFAIALACAAGCGGAVDPCAGHSGTCLALDVSGEGVDSVDQLRYQVSGLGALLTGASPSSPGVPVALPTETAIYFEPGVSGAATLIVDGELGGALVGSGSASVAIDRGGHQRASVALHGAGVDLAGGNFDLAGADFAGDDLSTVSPDLAPANVDLANRNFDLAGGSAPCPSGALFCDNFEGETLAFAPWSGSMSLTNGAIQLDNAHPFFNGSESLETSANGGAFALRKTFSQPITMGVLAIRFYLYVATGFGSQAVWLYLPNPPDTAISLGSSMDGLGWQLNADTVLVSVSGLTAGAWQCVELDLDFSAGGLSLYVTDGATPNRSAPPLLIGQFASSGLSTFDIGVYSSSGPTDAWFDDLAVATSHIGCE